MISFIRHTLGAVVLAADKVFPPGQKVQRREDRQKLVDQETAKLALYQFNSCPFCVKVRRQIKRLDLNIELRDVKAQEKYKNELVKEGGEYQVPCLRVQKDDGSIQWMYESDDINKYLEGRFA